MKLYVLLIYLVHCVTGEAVTTLGMIARDETNLPRSCTIERAYKLLTYVCSNLNLKEIPQHLRSSVEILDVSFNRIRELNRNSFARYTDVRYLYLFENMIQIIETNTFAQLTNLEAIDLSTNGLTTLPMELFSLPLLRNMHASDNALVHLHNDLKNLSKPVSAPLRIITIANCKLNKVPDFGVLPELLILNISTNDLLDITPQQISPFCGIETIDLNNTRIPPCPCKALSYYLMKRSIKTSNVMSCDDSGEIYCTDVTNTTLDSEDFEYCASLRKEKKLKEKSKWTWMSVFGGLLGFFVIFMGMLYIFHRRNVRRIRELNEITVLKQIHQIHQAEKSQNIELLISKEGS